MDLKQINKLELDDVFEKVLERIVDFSAIPEGETKYIFASSGGSKYNRLILNSRITKPKIEEFELVLEAWKEDKRQELAAVEILEQERLVEIERINAIKERWNAIRDIRMCDSYLGFNNTNIKLELKRIIKENDIAKLEEYEAAAIVVDAAESEREQEVANSAAELAQLKQAYNIVNSWESLQDVQFNVFKKLMLRLIKEMR